MHMPYVRHALQRLPDTLPQEDSLAVEVPVALVYNGVSHAVMMATPAQLDWFALGFSLSEGIALRVEDIFDIEVKPVCRGFEVQIELASACFQALKARRRQLAGRTGCGLCGVEQIDALFREHTPLAATQQLAFSRFAEGLSALQGAQTLARETGATHAAAWMAADGRLLQVCEDVGRHVALDKLLGWRARSGEREGAVLVTSRASYEMVEKCLSQQVEILAAVSAPTALAVDMAERYGLTLLGFTRGQRANLYSVPARILPND